MDSKVEYIDGVFLCTSSGEAEVGPVADLIDAMLSHAKWKPGTPRCYDISNLDAGPLTVNDIKRISVFSAERKAQLGAGKIAVVAGRDLEYGLSRMLSVYISRLVDSECQVFRSRDEALAWLTV